MTQPARPDPLAAAARVTGAAKDLAADLTEGFRKSDRAFKRRTGVLGTWLVLAIASIWIACPSSGPSNSLGAVARLDLNVGGVMGNQVYVENGSGQLWTEVGFTLDDTWRASRTTVRPGDHFVLGMSAFKKDGQQAPDDLKPARLVIECAEGKVVLPLGAARP